MGRRGRSHFVRDYKAKKKKKPKRRLSDQHLDEDYANVIHIARPTNSKKSKNKSKKKNQTQVDPAAVQGVGSRVFGGTYYCVGTTSDNIHSD
jgi:hypothetical protein